MPIRPMTNEEIRAGLHRAAVVCIEKSIEEWWSNSVTIADGVFNAAYDTLTRQDDSGACDSNHAATFLLFVRESLQ